MCCGKSRNPFQTAGPTRPAAPVRGLPIRPQFRPVVLAAPPRPMAHPLAPRASVQFEYAGKTALNVVSPATGRRYLFDRPGARLAIDPRDQAYLRGVPNSEICTVTLERTSNLI